MADNRAVSELSRGPSTAILLAIFVTATSTLAFEVALTRAFSVLLRYHFVFLAISLATCGLGIGGLIDYLLHRRFPRWHVPTQLALRGMLTGILYPLSVYLLFATPLSAKLTSVWVVSAICICPFLAAGSLLSRAFAEYSSSSGRLYFADLAGAAIGSFGVIAILQLVGAINAAVSCGLLVALGAVALAFSVKNTGLSAGALVVLGGLAILLGTNVQMRYLDLPVMPLSDDPSAKPLYQELADPNLHAKIVASEWNAFARTDVVAYGDAEGNYDSQDDLYVYTDGEVPTNMIAFDGDLTKIGDRLRGFIGFIPFEKFRPERVMLIGPGGGLDILLGLAVGADEIVGAELNPSIPRIVRQFGDFTGHIYDYENVNIYVDEGRAFMQRSDAEFDMIYMALTKTATTASSSLALVESYIHTEDAFVDCLEHLSSDGKIAFVCQEPMILLRTMLTAREALHDVGVPYEETMHHLLAASLPMHMYFTGPYRQLLVISRDAVDKATAEDFTRHIIAMRLDPVYAPGAYEPVPFNWLTEDRSMSAGEFVDRFNAMRAERGAMPLNLMPCTDDRPFVVDLSFGIPGQFKAFLWGMLLVALVISAVLVIMVGSREHFEQGRGKLSIAIVYFILLGIGFMLVETSLIQKLVLYLGYPVLSLSTLLFAVLISGALGSLFTQRFGIADLPRLVAYAATGIIVYGLISQYMFPRIVDATLAFDIRWRCLFTMVMLFPLGFCLGMPFPSGIRVVGRWGHDIVPWLWGINGVTSVVGSVSAMALAKVWGFGQVQIAGWVLYLGVLAIALMAARHIGAKTEDTPDAQEVEVQAG